MTMQPTTIFYECTCPPQKHNRGPWGSLYRFKPNQQEIMTYIQVNKDTEDPIWLPVQEFFMDIFGPQLKDQSFIELCLKKYELILMQQRFYSDLEESMMVK
jgi:hypothetical protein